MEIPKLDTQIHYMAKSLPFQKCCYKLGSTELCRRSDYAVAQILTAMFRNLLESSCSSKGEQISAHGFKMRCLVLRCPHIFGHVVYYQITTETK